MRPPIGRILCLIIAILALCPSVSHLRGYALGGLSWPDGDIAMRLQLGSTGVVLQDGSGTWNNSAADALALWNQQLNFVHLSWNESEGPGAMADGVNSVFFSSTIFGEGFGTNVLAVTVARYDASTQRMLETDTIFNTAQSFNSTGARFSSIPGRERRFSIFIGWRCTNLGTPSVSPIRTKAVKALSR